MYIVYDGDYLKTKNLKNLTKTIYENFIELENYPILSHTKKTILETLNKPDCIFIINYDEKKKRIIGYLLGYIEYINNDNRKVFFVSYLYVSSKYRTHGIGSKLMNIAHELTQSMKCDGTMLICDTEDEPVYNFYLRKQYMPDMNLRRYEKHEVMYRNSDS